MTSSIAIHIAATGKTIARAVTYVGVEGLEELSIAETGPSIAEVFVETGTKVTEVLVLVTPTLVSTPAMVVGTTAVVLKISVLSLRVTDAWPAFTAKVVAALRDGLICGSGVALRLRTGTEVPWPVLATPTVDSEMMVRTAVVVMIVVLRPGTMAARLTLELLGTPAVQGGGVSNTTTTTDTDLRARIAEVE